MPSPFPGMDPYLEDPRLWRGVHDRMIPLIAKAINDALPDGYFADIDERVYISEPRRTIPPDVAVLRMPERESSMERAAVIDYEYEPIPPIREADAAWLDNLLRRESVRQ